MEKKLTRSNNKQLFGVCAGIAEYFNIDPTIVRVLYICLTLFTLGLPGVILYFLLGMVIPAKVN